MRAPLVRLGCLLSLLIASSASAVTYEWTPVGSPGNACDPQSQGCFGAVDHEYSIGTYEVTNLQYTEFLNAKAAASDPYGLYNTEMGDGGSGAHGGITRIGSEGSYTYFTTEYRREKPVNWVSFYDAMRFANWLHNGQGDGDTETGAYTLLGGTPEPSNGTTVTRNEGARVFVPSQDEWYKAAYHDALDTCAGDYCAYPAGSSTQTTCAPPSATANRANCSYLAASDLSTRGSYTGSPSPYGTFDQGGNVMEWNEAIVASLYREYRGGAFFSGYGVLAASFRTYTDPWFEHYGVGFRVALLPEPGRDLVVILALLALASLRRVTA